MKKLLQTLLLLPLFVLGACGGGGASPAKGPTTPTPPPTVGDLEPAIPGSGQFTGNWIVNLRNATGRECILEYSFGYNDVERSIIMC